MNERLVELAFRLLGRSPDVLTTREQLEMLRLMIEERDELRERDLVREMQEWRESLLASVVH